MKYEVKIILVIEAYDATSAGSIGVAACLHLQHTFNDDGSILETLIDGVNRETKEKS